MSFPMQHIQQQRRSECSVRVGNFSLLCQIVYNDDTKVIFIKSVPLWYAFWAKYLKKTAVVIHKLVYHWKKYPL